MMMIDVEGRRKGRPKRRWMDSVNVGLREKGLSGSRRKTGLCVSKCQKHRPPKEVGKHVVEGEAVCCSCDTDCGQR